MQCPDFMHSKLIQMLNKNSNTLHAFIELGGLSKIYKLLKISYNNDNEREVIKWLQILNHDQFPIDIDVIRALNLGKFINTKIKAKWDNVDSNISNLTSSIKEKWLDFAAKENQITNENKKRVLFYERDLCEKRITFKKYDKPIQINGIYKESNHDKAINVESILKSTKNHKVYTESPSNDLGDLSMDYEVGNRNEYTLE